MHTKLLLVTATVTASNCLSTDCKHDGRPLP